MSDDLLKHAEETAREFRSTMPPSVMKEWGKEAATLLNAMRKRVREAEEARDVFAELNRIGSENAEAVRKERDALAARVREAEAELDALTADNVNLSEQAFAILAERDAALAAIASEAKGIGIAYEESKKVRAERDTALASLDAERAAGARMREAAWIAGRDAASAWHEQQAAAWQHSDPGFNAHKRHTAHAKAIRALQPPAALASVAAEAGRDE